MKLHHLSASSAKLFESCEAQWHAKYEGGGIDVGGEAAGLGSALHVALEQFLSNVDSGSFKSGWTQLLDAYKEAYWEQMSGPELYEEGAEMLKGWFARQLDDYANWIAKTVISFEQRSEMILETKYAPIPFVYIIDRLDQHEDGEIEVVDYKSGRWQQSGSDLRHDIQARSYATAVWKLYPNQNLYWVTFDYLRNEPVGVSFRSSECQEHYNYLVRLAERIIESDGTKETLNSMCRFCIRKSKCKTVARYEVVDGTIGEDVNTLVRRRVELGHLQKAVEASLADIDEAVKSELKSSDEVELDVDGVTVFMAPGRRTRVVDIEAVLDVIGKDEAEDYIKIAATELDVIIKRYEEVGADSSKLKKAVSYRNGRSTLRYREPKW